MATYVAHLTADETGATTATLANTSLSFSVTSGVYYIFRFYVCWRSTSTSVSLKVGLTTPTFTVFGAEVRTMVAAAGVGGELQGSITASGGSVSGATTAAANTDYISVVEGIILPSATGTLMLQYAANTTGATVTMRQASAAELIEV